IATGTNLARVNPQGIVSVISNIPQSSPPYRLALDSKGNLLATYGLANLVYRIAIDGSVSVFAGTGQFGLRGDGDGGPAASAALNFPWGLAACPDGSVYIGDQGTGRVRKVDAKGIITTYAGGGPSFQDGVPATRSVVSVRDLACD